MAGAAPDDEALAASVGEPACFEAVFDRRAREVWWYLAARLGAGTADELLSEVFVRAFAARRSYDARRGSARAWLYGIAHNVIRERLRTDARRRRHEGVAGAPDAAPDAAVEVAERGALQRALATLPDAWRDVVLLVGALELSYEEAATALGVPVGTVRSRLARARRQLRQLLAEEGTVNDAQRHS